MNMHTHAHAVFMTEVLHYTYTASSPLSLYIAVALFVLGRRLGCLDEEGAPSDSQQFISDIQTLLQLIPKFRFSLPLYRILQAKDWKRFLEIMDRVYHFTLLYSNKKLEDIMVSLFHLIS